VEKAPLLVIKKNGERQVFEGEKILRGLIKACEKRPVPVEQLHQLVDSVEKQLRNSLEREIPSSQIGELVMERLVLLDEVAYVRFASVYRQFSDVSNFLKELERLIGKKGNGTETGVD
jgi:transcriptional repressor NrdR